MLTYLTFFYKDFSETITIQSDLFHLQNHLQNNLYQCKTRVIYCFICRICKTILINAKLVLFIGRVKATQSGVTNKS